MISQSRNLLFQVLIFGFHVKLQRCNGMKTSGGPGFIIPWWLTFVNFAASYLVAFRFGFGRSTKSKGFQWFVMVYLGGGFIFLFSPRKLGEMIPILTNIFETWLKPTKQRSTSPFRKFLFANSDVFSQYWIVGNFQDVLLGQFLGANKMTSIERSTSVWHNPHLRYFV